MQKKTANYKPESLLVLKVPREVEALHRRCGVYTNPVVVCQILDDVGWKSEADLSRLRLLEPAAGNGAFVVEAARRLVAAYIRCGIDLTMDTLAERITAYELHDREARIARSQVVGLLLSAGAHHRTAEACARSWILNGDFLLANLPPLAFTHAVGNPPYVRWSKIPPNLKAKYESILSREMIGGDLFLPFLDRALESLGKSGRCGFLCSDRWRFMAFAEGFRKKWLPNLKIDSEHAVQASEAFVKDVDSYPTILIASKDKQRAQIVLSPKRQGKTLAELGCIVKVGPALGHAPAYVLQRGEQGVEPKLLKKWVDGTDIKEGAVTWSGRRVVAMYGKDKKLIELKRFPLLKSRLERFRKRLRQRSIVAQGALWFRPIDRVVADDWNRPKLLVPELAKTPRVAIDRTGLIPSHGVYAIFAPDDDVEALYEKLRDGKLAAALKGIAPKVKGGYVRCYRRFLLMMRLN